MTTEEKDAEIERLKGELAEAFRLLKPFDDWFTLDVYAVKSACFAAKAFLQKHTTLSHGKVVFERYVIGEGGKMSVEMPVAPAEPIPPPLNCGSAAAGESPSHSGGGEPLLGALQELLRNVRAGLLGVSEISTVLGRLIGDYQTGKSALREVPPTGDDHSTGELPRQQPEGSTPSLPANWRPRHMDEGDDYVNEPRTGPVSDGPPGQNMESK